MKFNKLFAVALAACTLPAFGLEKGFTSLFDGKTMNGWVKNGGTATYSVENGVITGRFDPATKYNTFLCTNKDYENFILKLEFKCDEGNSGVQFRSATYAPNKDGVKVVYGYQAEIRPSGESCGRIYDEGRRGYKHGIVWLDLSTPEDRLVNMQKVFRKGDWNTMEIQCVGPSIKTWVNGVKVTDILDDCMQKGFIGLQIHSGKSGVAHWRNIRIKELPACPPWKKFFVNKDGKWQLDGAYYVIPQDWSFVEDKGGAYLKGIHDQKEKRDGLVISEKNYSDFMARVTYKINGGNSALYFRAEEVDTPWVLKGFQNEIAGNNVDSALWHTAGKVTRGRGWVAKNEELVKKVRQNGWNTVSTIAIGNRIVNRLNGFETFDIIDPLAEVTGKLGLQLHGSAKNEMSFKNFEVMPLPPELVKLMYR